MDITISVDKASTEIAGNHSRKVSVSLEGVVLDEIVDAIGKDKILDHIGRSDCIDHFDIEEAGEES